jgi:dienelactone hydrolase
MVSPTQLSVIRMIPTARAVARAARGRLAVYRLLNSFRGWDAEHTPVADTDWAIEQVRETYSSAPIGLVGHSLGGRAALVAGDNPTVRSVVALNPWLYPTEDVDLPGRRVLFVHGRRDRIASPQRAEAAARRLSRHTDVGFIWIPEGKHAMLRHGRDFDQYAAQFTAAVLLDDPSLASGPVSRVLAGESWVTV